MATPEEERRRRSLADFVPTPDMAPNMNKPRAASPQNLASVYGQGGTQRLPGLQRLQSDPMGTLGAAFEHYATPVVEGVQSFGDSMRASRQNQARAQQQQAQQQAQQARQSFMQQQAVPGQPSMALRQPPQDRTAGMFASTTTGRDANPPSLGQRAIANQRLGGAEITEGPAGMQRQVQDGRTRYLGQGGMAEFQGTPAAQSGGFGGARTNADVQAQQADYARRGLNVYGNDMRAIGQLNQIADNMQRARLQNVVGNPEFSGRERGRSLAALAGLQQGQQIQQEGQVAQAQQRAQQQQQAIENTLAFERLGLDQDKFNAQVEKDGRVDPIALSQEIAETYDPINAPKGADGNPVDRQTYILQTMNDMFQAIGKVIGPDGTAYNAAEIQALADARFGGNVEAAKADMRAQGFLGV